MHEELTGDLIMVSGIRFVGYHGILPEERRDGCRYRADIVVQCAMEAASRTDKISSTIDYRKLCRIVVERGTGKRYNLIERVAGVIAEEILRETSATACAITLYKYPSDIEAESVAVRVVRKRADLEQPSPDEG